MTASVHRPHASIRRHAPTNAARQRQSGLTVLELMIALSIGLLLVAGIGTIFVGSSQTYRVQEDQARIQEAGRYAIETLGRSLRQAGYWNVPLAVEDTSSGTPPAVSFGGTPLGGAKGDPGDATATPPIPATDERITVQYDWTAGHRDCENNTGTAGDLVQESYSLNGGALRCDGEITAAPGAPGAGSVLIDNVEDMRILYGLDTTGDQAANRYVDAGNVANWNQVVSVRACLLIRSPNIGITTAAQRYLNCAGALGQDTTATAFTTAADSRLRRAFVATFNLRNRVNTMP